ncbi:hypothetical protein PH30N_05092 [Cutibacterium modestum 30N]|nr:hypothetical protein PA08_0226 [Cutibacterium modestum P08]MCP2375693.1 hypothetical protein [Cutibacterium modestum 28N]MCP2379371.1 hypothetical protein [Cutibacterium modestum 31N]MCP2380395.1 hypothetical protein [Cutibacterium modestum 30N]
MKSHKLLTIAVAAVMATSGLGTMIPSQSAHASGPSQEEQAQQIGPKTCVSFLGRPGSSGQFPLGIIPPNWGTNGWQRMGSANRPDLPSKVVMRDNNEGFNQRMDFALRDGKVYGRFQSENQWRHVDTPPCLDGQISAISVNDAMLVAVDSNGWVYTLNNLLSSPKDWGWFRAWGSPFWFGRGLKLDNHDQGRWALSLIDNQTDRTYRGVDGHDHPISLAMCTEIMMVSKDGAHIYQHDPWLQNDYSFEASTPYNSRFRVHSMSASGSVALITNDHGDMFTRLWDYDIAGTDPAQFRYTWQDQSNLPSPSTWLQGKINPRYAAIKLPPAGWKHQPKVPGEITDRLTVVSTAPGSQNRELRVEGRRDGHTGYWSKMIDAKTWTFVPTDQSLKGKSLDNPQRDTSKVGLGSASGVHYSGSLQGAATIDIKDFAYQSTTRTVDLKISGKTYPVKLHSIDGRLKTAISMLSPRKRGLTDTPRYYDAAIEVPDSYLEDPNFSSFMKGYMRGEKVHEVYLVVTKDSFKVINDRHPGIALRLGRNVSILHRVK